MKSISLCLLLLQCAISSPEEVKSYTCTPPFEAVGGGCFYYSSDVGITVDSYTVAETLCTAEGGHLGYVKTGDENTAIVDYFFGTSITDNKVLLGAQAGEDDVFVWGDGTNVNDGFDDWADGEPSGGFGCMGYSEEHGFMWDDFQCENYIASGLFVGFICEEPPMTTTTTSTSTTTTTTTTTTAIQCTVPFIIVDEWCYYLNETFLTYNDARDTCARVSSHLAFITTEEEQLSLESYLSGTGVESYIFIGGYDLFGDDTFYWLDFTPVVDGYTNFYPPEVDGGDQDALFLDNSIDWQWGDTYPYFSQSFLCERDVIESK